jgi:DNA modification methylase
VSSRILHGDCVEVMRTMEPCSIDACVTDPPYGLEFMGKEWDAPWRAGTGFSQPGIGDRPTPWPSFTSGSDEFGGANPTCATCGGRARGANKCGCSEPDWRVKGAAPDPMYARKRQMSQYQAWCEQWAREAYRVLKPGGFLVSFGGTRTWHRQACAIEDAGFEVRDSIAYLFGSGFPKSSRISRDLRFCQCDASVRNAACITREQSQDFRTDTGADVFGDGLLFVDAHHLIDTAQGSQVDYRRVSDSDGERLHPPEVSGRVSSPSQGCAQGHTHSGERGDVSVDAPSHNPSLVRYSDRLSNLDSDGLGCSAIADESSTPANTLPSDTCESDSRRSDRNHSVSRDQYSTGLPRCAVCNKPIADGLGTALKPGHEPVIMARKPFKGSVAGNVQAHGTGALNIDACRIGWESDDDKEATSRANTPGSGRFAPQSPFGAIDPNPDRPNAAGAYAQPSLGRWPANVCLDDLAALVLDEQSGELQGPGGPATSGSASAWPGGAYQGTIYPGEVGGASRFFYVAKPSREERDYGIWHDHTKSGGEATNRTDGSAGLNSPRAGAGRTGGSRNFHPTVKPVELMRWLVRLVTPIDGTVLDPFLGSGTTGMACRYELRSFIGIEREREYIEIAERRIAAVAPLFGDLLAADPEAGTDTGVKR